MKLPPEFWRINIGHIATMGVFIFGMGCGWAYLNADIAGIRERELSDTKSLEKADATNLQILGQKVDGITGARNEQIKNLDNRVALVEKFVSSQEELRILVAQLAVQVSFLKDAVTDLRADLKAQRGTTTTTTTKSGT